MGLTMETIVRRRLTGADVFSLAARVLVATTFEGDSISDLPDARKALRSLLFTHLDPSSLHLEGISLRAAHVERKTSSVHSECSR
jgi:hypothetical protein